MGLQSTSGCHEDAQNVRLGQRQPCRTQDIFGVAGDDLCEVSRCGDHGESLSAVALGSAVRSTSSSGSPPRQPPRGPEHDGIDQHEPGGHATQDLPPSGSSANAHPASVLSIKAWLPAHISPSTKPAMPVRR